MANDHAAAARAMDGEGGVLEIVAPIGTSANTYRLTALCVGFGLVHQYLYEFLRVNNSHLPTRAQVQ